MAEVLVSKGLFQEILEGMPVFGQIKDVRGFDRFMRRGIEACSSYSIIILTPHDIALFISIIISYCRSLVYFGRYNYQLPGVGVAAAQLSGSLPDLSAAVESLCNALPKPSGVSGQGQ